MQLTCSPDAFAATLQVMGAWVKACCRVMGTFTYYDIFVSAYTPSILRIDLASILGRPTMREVLRHPFLALGYESGQSDVGSSFGLKRT